MNTKQAQCSPCSGNCRQGRDCPALWADTEAVSSTELRYLGVALVLSAAVSLSVVVGVVASIGRALGAW